jgi:hypothetical protein
MADNLDKLKRVLKAFFELHSITVTGDSLRLWLDSFQGMPLEAIESAIRRFNTESDQRPTPAAVRRYAGAAGLSDEQRAQAAWRVVRSTILRYGAYYRINFDDPIVHAAIRAIGGWTQLCNTASEEMHWKAKAFVDAYVSVARSGIGEFQPLAGLLQTQQPVEVVTGLLPHATAGAITMAKPVARTVRIPDLSVARLKE